MIPKRALTELEGAACAPLLAALAGIRDEPPLGMLERLRERWNPEVVAAAVEVQWARTLATEKFAARAADLWCDREGVQMASSPAAAAWKACRFAHAAGSRVVDLCCGIGGDLMELARACGAERVAGVDCDESRAWMAGRNSGARVEWGDALGARVDGALVHADPARRVGHRRLLDAHDLQPPLSELLAACRAARGLAIKLGPGMDLAPADIGAHGELEFLCENSTLTQQVLWGGVLAHHPGRRTATLVESGATLTGSAGDTPCSDDGAFRRMIAVPNPALERAGLLHAVAGSAREPAPGLGILTADDIAASPWYDRHEVRAELQARERTVAEWLRAHGGGNPVVHTRGKACDPAQWQRDLRSPGAAQHHVWVLRIGDRRTALVTRPS